VWERLRPNSFFSRSQGHCEKKNGIEKRGSKGPCGKTRSEPPSVSQGVCEAGRGGKGRGERRYLAKRTFGKLPKRKGAAPLGTATNRASQRKNGGRAQSTDFRNSPNAKGKHNRTQKKKKILRKWRACKNIFPGGDPNEKLNRSKKRPGKQTIHKKLSDPSP